MRIYRVGIIGCGNIFTMHAISVSLLEGTKLVAICDIKKDKLKMASIDYPDAEIFTDYHDMIDTMRLDAVHICTPHYIHTEMAKYAFSKGVHVLTEKPMSITYNDAAECVGP